MMMFNEFISDLIKAEKVILTKQTGEEFASFLERNYLFNPVTGYTIDWPKVANSVRLRWDVSDDCHVADFLKKTTLSRHQEVFVWLGRETPLLSVLFVDAIKYLDELFSQGWGARYMFGHGSKYDFIEVDRASWLSGIRLHSSVNIC